MDYAYIDNVLLARKLGVYAPELLTHDQLSAVILDILFG